MAIGYNVKKQLVANNLNTSPQTSVTTPTTNQYSAISSPKASGSTVSNTSTNTTIGNTGLPKPAPMASNTTSKPTTTVPTHATIAPPNIVNTSKPFLDQQLASDKDYLDKWKQNQFSNLESTYKNQLAQMENSKTDLEKWYTGEKDDLGETLYNQQEQLNVDGSNRGISNSAQILGLQGVHNINYNKNLTKLMEQKTSLLNDINLKINEINTNYTNSKGDIETEALGQYNDFNKTYTNDILDLLNQQYQQDLDEYNDSKYSYGGSGGSGGYGGYSGYGRYSGRSSYSPYNYSGYSSYKPSSNEVDTSNNRVLNAGLDEYKNVSSDAYNYISGNIDSPNVDNFYDMIEAYNQTMQPYNKALSKSTPDKIEEANKIRQVARDMIWKKAKGNSTNTPYVLNKQVVNNIRPWNDKTLKENIEKARRIELNRSNSIGRMTSRVLSRTGTPKSNTTINKTNWKASTSTPVPHPPSSSSSSKSKNTNYTNWKTPTSFSTSKPKPVAKTKEKAKYVPPTSASIAKSRMLGDIPTPKKGSSKPKSTKEKAKYVPPTSASMASSRLMNNSWTIKQPSSNKPRTYKERGKYVPATNASVAKSRMLGDIPAPKKGSSKSSSSKAKYVPPTNASVAKSRMLGKLPTSNKNKKPNSKKKK